MKEVRRYDIFLIGPESQNHHSCQEICGRDLWNSLHNYLTLLRLIFGPEQFFFSRVKNTRHSRRIYTWIRSTTDYHGWHELASPHHIRYLSFFLMHSFSNRVTWKLEFLINRINWLSGGLSGNSPYILNIIRHSANIRTLYIFGRCCIILVWMYHLLEKIGKKRMYNIHEACITEIPVAGN